MLIRRGLMVISLLMLLMIGSLTAQAQTSLTYGTGLTGELSLQAPVAVYTFQGQANDFITLQVLALTPGLQPTVSINTATNVQVATSSTTAADLASGIARINVTLPESGTYIILLSSVNLSVGDYALRLDGVPSSGESIVGEGETGNNDVTTGTSALNYTVTANETTPLLATISASGTGVSFTVRVLSPAGNQLALVDGSSAESALVTLPATVGTYTLEVLVSATDTGNISLSVTPIGDPPPPADNPPPPTTTAQDGEAPPPTATVSQEQAPPPTATVPQEQAPPPTATVPQQQAPPPTATTNVQPTVAPTATVNNNNNNQNQPTATFTPSHTPTLQATATFTPSYTPTTQPAPQLAPADARFNTTLVIPLDNTASTLDFVSYPDGDTEDRVRYEVSGMNNVSTASGGRARLVISVSCFGTNTDQVQIFTGGQTYSCGQTIVDREVTADSDTGSVVITAVGGTGTYVQWVLTGTATRVN